MAFCPILLILSIALTDRAFKSDWLREPADLFDFEVVEDRGMLGIPLEWRDDIREVPVMREVEKAVCGYETSSHRGLRYDTARCALVRLGRAVGLKDPLHFYTGRRGFGEAVDCKSCTGLLSLGHRLTHKQHILLQPSAIAPWATAQKSTTNSTPIKLLMEILCLRS